MGGSVIFPLLNPLSSLAPENRKCEGADRAPPQPRYCTVLLSHDTRHRSLSSRLPTLEDGATQQAHTAIESWDDFKGCVIEGTIPQFRNRLAFDKVTRSIVQYRTE